MCFRIQKRKHNRVKTWTRHVDLFQKDFIFVPINESWVYFCVEDTHYILYFYDWLLKSFSLCPVLTGISPSSVFLVLTGFILSRTCCTSPKLQPRARLSPPSPPQKRRSERRVSTRPAWQPSPKRPMRTASSTQVSTGDVRESRTQLKCDVFGINSTLLFISDGLQRIASCYGTDDSCRFSDDQSSCPVIPFSLELNVTFKKCSLK